MSTSIELTDSAGSNVLLCKVKSEWKVAAQQQFVRSMKGETEI